MDEDNKSRQVDVREMRNTPVIIEGITGVATWDDTHGRLCFTPDTQSAGYREAAQQDGGTWEQWIIENEITCTGVLLRLEIVP